MRRFAEFVAVACTGAVVLQFGGCVAASLADVFYVVGPLLL